MPAGRPPRDDTLAVLEFLRRQDEPANMAQISEALGMDRARVSRILNVLKNTGRACRANPEVPPTHISPATYSPTRRLSSIVPPPRINKMEGKWMPPKWESTRPGAMDAFNIPSRGF